MGGFQNPIVLVDEYRAYAPWPSFAAWEAHRPCLVAVAFVKLCHALGGLYM